MGWTITGGWNFSGGMSIVSPPPPPLIYLWSWGKNSSGQLGQNDRVYRSRPAQVGAGSTVRPWSNIASGTGFGGGIKPDGTLWTWGVGQYGSLGFNDGLDKSSPTQVGALTNWKLVSNSMGYNTIAIQNDGSLWSWGQNNVGQLGQNNLVHRSSPTQVGSNTNWSLVSAGSYTILATKTDGSLWSWGYNALGQLGQFGGNKSSPTQIGSGTNWNQVSIYNWHALATKTDGTLWSWGYNNYGQLGQNDTVNRSSPVQVGALTNWNQISAGYNFSIATKTDGTLWAWGHGGSGELGQSNTIATNNSPLQIGSATNWNLISAGNYSVLATKTDGSLWAWGNDYGGQLGQGDKVYRSSPAMIGSGTNWTLISIATYNVLAVG